MKRALGLALAAGLGVVLGVPGVASAAWHADSPTPVAIGWTDSAKPGKAFPTGNGLDLPLGTSQDDAGTTHTSRVYATFDLSEYEGAKVTGGTLYIVERSAADCTKRSIEVWRTKALPSLPTWNKAPAELSKLDEIQTPEYCPRANISFDVSSAIADAVAKKQRLVSFVLRVSADHETDPAYGRELNWYSTVRLSLSHNTVPKIDNAHLYNAGFPCTQLKPYPVVGSFAGSLQALVTDPDEMERLTAEFAIWPVGSPDDRTTYNDGYPQSGRVASANVRSQLVQGMAYGWQARVSDGTETSSWSKKCFFKYDGLAPSAPVVTWTNHQPDTWGPVGEHPTFVFDGHKDKDIAGFQYSWSGLGVPSTCEGGDYGQLICKDPLDQIGTVKADVPGGKATVTLNPDRTGPARLFVRSIDRAGNASPETVYSAVITRNEPVITVESGTPEWNQEVLLKITPAPGITGVTEYEIKREGQNDTETRTPDEDGVAYYSFIASEANGPHLEIRSRSGDNFVSAPANWIAYFPPWPGIQSDVYDTTGAQPKGGVGVEGTFTFTPPPGWQEVATYRYTIDADWDTEPTVIEADENGRASVTWTPQTAGYHSLEVNAVKPDGTMNVHGHSVSFQVAG